MGVSGWGLGCLGRSIFRGQGSDLRGLGLVFRSSVLKIERVTKESEKKFRVRGFEFRFEILVFRFEVLGFRFKDRGLRN